MNLNYIALIIKYDDDQIDDLHEYIKDSKFKYIKLENTKIKHIKDEIIMQHIMKIYKFKEYNILTKIYALDNINNTTNMKDICHEIYQFITHIAFRYLYTIFYNQLNYTKLNNDYNNDTNKDNGILTICYVDDIEDYIIKNTLIDSLTGVIFTNNYVHDIYI